MHVKIDDAIESHQVSFLCRLGAVCDDRVGEQNRYPSRVECVYAKKNKKKNLPLLQTLTSLDCKLFLPP